MSQDGDLERRLPPHDREAERCVAYVAFWTASLLTSGAAFVLTSTPVNGVSA